MVPPAFQPDPRAIAALAAICRWGPETARALMVEDLLSRLEQELPGVAQIAASLLVALGTEDGREIADQLLARLGDYAGGAITATVEAVDVLVTTVKPTELSATLAAFDVPDGDQPFPLSGTGLCAWFVERDNLRYAITMVGTAGNVETAVLIGSLRALIGARLAVLVGMAAGVRDQVQLGDVVVAELVLEYERVIARRDGVLLAPRAYNVPEWRIRHCREINRRLPNWSRSVADAYRVIMGGADWPADETETLGEWFPQVHRGVILAGGILHEDGNLPGFAESVHGRTHAAEMEGAGFAAACDEAQMPWLVVRGIADYGEPQRRKHWQFPATFAAARYTRDALRIQLLPHHN